MDDEGHVWEVARRLLNVVWPQIFHVLVTERQALVKLDNVDSQLECLLIHRVGDVFIVAAPALAIDVRVVELERARVQFFDLPFHLVQHARTMVGRVDAAAEEDLVGIGRAKAYCACTGAKPSRNQSKIGTVWAMTKSVTE